MKELSIEEKAKAYDKAIEKAKDALNDGTISSNTIAYLQDIFPELKENGDEKIRQFLIHEIEETSDEIMSYRGMNKESVIAWLEKQGEQKPVNEDAEKEKSNYVSGQFLYCKGSFNEFKEGESYWLEYIGNDTYVGRSDNVLNQKFHITPRQLYTWLDPRHPEHPKEEAPMSYGKELEFKLRDACARYYSNGGDTISLAGVFYAGVEAQKEIEQKPADKVEPKFKVGDCIVNNEYNNVAKVIEVNEQYYRLDYYDTIGTISVELIDNEYHLWTIADAKDGDFIGCNKNGWTCIFKTLNNDGTFCSYCFIDADGWFYESGSKCHRLTKEVIKALHYKYCPATKEQRELLFQKMKGAGYKWDAEKKELRKIEDEFEKQYKKKSKEKTKIYDSMDDLIADALIEEIEGSELDDRGKYNRIHWIESHRQKHTWSEDDKKMFVNIKACLRNANKDYSREIDWLKSIKPQPKNEWSEEDERERKRVVGLLEGWLSTFKETCYAEDCKCGIVWLKSLKPQKQWKPTEEQMGVIEAVINNKSFQRRHLDSIYEQLKKLRG